MEKGNTPIFFRRYFFEILAVNIMISFIFSFSFLYFSFHKNKITINESIKKMIDATIPSLTRSIAYEDDQQIEVYLKGLIKHEDIVYLELTRVYENVIEDQPEYKIGILKKENGFEKKIDLRYKRENEDVSLVGKIKLIITYPNLLPFLKSQFKLISLIFLTYLIIMPLFFLITFNRMEKRLSSIKINSKKNNFN